MIFHKTQRVRAILAAHLAFEGDRRALHELIQRHRSFRARTGKNEVHERPGYQFLLGKTKNLGPGRVQAFEMTVKAGDSEKIKRLVKVAVAFGLGRCKNMGEMAYLII